MQLLAFLDLRESYGVGWRVDGKTSTMQFDDVSAVERLHSKSLKVYISQRLIYRKNPLLLLQNNSAESWKGIHFLYFVCNDPTATSVVRSGGNLSTVFDYF